MLLSYGFLLGEKLANNIIKIFQKCREIWKKEDLYDFGLRALRSVIEYSAKLLIKGDEGEEGAVIESLRILTVPKMKTDDRYAFEKIVAK